MATKQTTVRDRIRKAIDERYPLPAELETIRQCASWDLYHGPGAIDRDDPEAAPYHGFTDACARLAAWADAELPNQLWYDDDCGMLLDSEPESWEDENGETIEPCLDTVYVVNSREIRAAVIGRELSTYL